VPHDAGLFEIAPEPRREDVRVELGFARSFESQAEARRELRRPSPQRLLDSEAQGWLSCAARLVRSVCADGWLPRPAFFAQSGARAASTAGLGQPRMLGVTR
jgi:hypothetical protein